MSENTAYQVKIDNYEGPFDLLLKAIDDGNLDIFSVSLSRITYSYFEYWKATLPSLINASDFLIMAAYLIELKSKNVLPKRADEMLGSASQDEIESSLIDHIQEYEIYKKIATNLLQRKDEFKKIFSRHEGESVENEIKLKDVSLKDLVSAFNKIYKEAADREKVVQIPREEITLEKRIEEIKGLIEKNPDGVPFENLFFRRTRLEIVVTFLAILELAKQQMISIKQGQEFGSILIFPKGVNDGTE
ncbi:MAG: segregation/condensation protein A [Candidatus Margulisiibacteriota bacterium]